MTKAETKAIKRERRKRNQERNKAAFLRLVELFPLAFAAGDERRPLKIGIYHDIRAKGLTSARLTSLGLRYYTRGKLYRKALVEGAERIDLDGNPAGVVAATELRKP